MRINLTANQPSESGRVFFLEYFRLCGEPKLTLSGILKDQADIEHFIAQLNKLHQEWMARSIHVVVFDLTNLVACSREGLKQLSLLAEKIGALPAEQHYRIEFRINSHRQWQTIYLSMIHSQFPDAITIQNPLSVSERL